MTEEVMLWVGIGASAGGLEALQAMAAALPVDANATYIVAQHLSPKHQSMMVQLIQRNTRLKVQEAKNGIIPQPNTIYITPPNKDIYVENKRIHLSAPQDDHSPKPCADRLFVSMAEELGPYSIAVVLSGTGSDGARGIREIRAAGGICIAQEQSSAKYDGMPNAAIETDCIDVILKPEKIAEHITKLASKFPLANDLIDVEKTEHQDGFSELLELIHAHTKVNLKDYKKATLKRRVERRMLARGINLFEDYLDYARCHAEELELLFQDILISVTEFYRDKKAFDALQPVIQEVIDNKEVQQTIRVWVVGCATGEEVYTVAMMFAEALGGIETFSERNLQFFATDIDTNALSKARKGVYPITALKTLPKSYQDRYFKKNIENAEVIKPIRDTILFSKHNIIQDPPFMRIDLICCRNLLIYFENDLQKRIYHLFHYALQQQGYLFLGKSESTLQTTQLFATVDPTSKIFQKRHHFKGDPSAGRYLLQQRGDSSKSELSVVRKRPNRQMDDLFEGLVNKLAEGAVLINESLDVEWIYGELTPFMKMRQGRPKMNLLDLVGDVHRDEIRALVYKAQRENTVIEGQPRKNKIGDTLFRTQVAVYPIRLEKHGTNQLLVTFAKLGIVTKGTAAVDVAEKDNSEAAHVRELEEELAAAREHLQTVIEELETSNEELQSLNEELQSANEELQSTNEELETANEELQSTNEELVTVNDELSVKGSDFEKLSLKLQQIKNSLDFPLLVVDEHFRVFASNEVARKRFNIKDNSPALANVLPEYCEPEKVQKITREVIQTGKTKSLHLDGEKRSYWLRVIPYRQIDGKVVGAVHTYIDFTARRKAENELARAKLEAEKANNAKSDFLANISHDIRTPMNAINGVISILRSMQVPDDKRDELLRTIAVSSDELKQLIEELLDFAKLEAGRMELDIQEFNLKELLNTVEEITSFKAKEKSLAFEVQVADSVPKRVSGDALKIRQILINLLGNAIKFTSEGKVTLTVKKGKKISGAVPLVFTVTDTGIGIPEEKLEVIFDKFSQAETSTAHRFGGTGLGLSISKELIALMEGTIDVKSKKGSGSVFTVTLPLNKANGSYEATAPVNDEVTPLFNRLEAAENYPLLIVEDNASNITILTSYLDHLGCYYEVARSGKQALEKTAEKEYSVVLMDIHMEEMDGFETTKRIQKQCNEMQRQVPIVVAITGHVQKKIEETAYRTGIKRFLKKPLEINELRQTMVELLPALAEEK